MKGYVIEKATRKIVTVIENVVSASDTQITGENAECRGMDATIASVVVSDAVHEVGEILPESVVDNRGQLPETEPEKIARLETENAQQKVQLAQQQDMINATSDNLTSFMEYMTNPPV